MKRIFLTILTSFLLFSSMMTSLYAGGDSWKTALYSFLNNNKKYIGYGAALLAGSGLIYSGYKKAGVAVCALAAGLPLYNWYNNNDKIPSVDALRKSLEESKKKLKEQVPKRPQSSQSEDDSKDTNDSLTKIKEINFYDWYEACNKLPKYEREKDHNDCGIDADTFESTIDEFIQSEQQRLDDAEWLRSKFSPNKSNIRITKEYVQIVGPFLPFVQKLEVEPDDVIAFHGDLHGDVHSLLESIKDLRDKEYMDQKNPFKIRKKNFKLIFLGDYVDRGWYGAEVIYTILRLKLENPEQVFLVRGNHEDIMINSGYGFLGELERKWGTSDLRAFCNKIHTMYTLMPVALYIGSADGSGNKDFIQCCHGGLEIGHNPQELLQSNAHYELLEKLYIGQNLLALSLSEKEKNIIDDVGLPEIYKDTNLTPQKFISEDCPFGYQWNDFEVDPKIFLSYGRSLKCGKDFTRKILEQHSSTTHRVQGIFRAHQHADDPEYDMMKRITNADKKGHNDDRGCGKLWIPEGIKAYMSGNRRPKNPKKLWPGIVCTFSVSPHTPYKPALRGIGETYGLLKIKSGFENWELEMVRLNEQKRQAVTEEDEEEYTGKGKEKVY